MQPRGMRSGDTHCGSTDAVEEEDLNARDDRIDDGEVDDGERLDVIFLEQPLVCRSTLAPGVGRRCRNVALRARVLTYLERT